MAGKKGRSGGFRAGAGRKPDPPMLVDDKALETVDPDRWLRAAMNSPEVPMKFRLRAAAILRQAPIAPLEVIDALYLKAMAGSVTAQVHFLRSWQRRKKKT